MQNLCTISKYEVRIPITELLANPSSADWITMTGSLGSYNVKISRTKAMNNFKFELVAITMGRVEITQDIYWVICPKTGGVAVTPPTPYGQRVLDVTGGWQLTLPANAYYKRIQYASRSSSANLNFTAWDIEDIYPQCGQFYRYKVDGPSNITSKLTYPEPGYSQSYCDYNIDRCRNIRVHYTYSVGVYVFYLHLQPVFGQNSISVPYYVDITPCQGYASLYVNSNSHPPNIVLDKADTLNHNTEFNFYPSYYNRYYNSQPT